MRSREWGILEVGKYLDLPGVLVTKRQCVAIPRQPQEFPNYGKGHCVYCGSLLPPRRRKYCCDKCGMEYRIATSEYTCIWWNDFRYAIIKRDNHMCVECDSKGSYGLLEVHHRIPLNKGGREFDPDNCMTLCCDCHKEKHRKRLLEPDGKSTQSKMEGW